MVLPDANRENGQASAAGQAAKKGSTRRPDGCRTPGPLDPNEHGPLAGDTVVPKGKLVFWKGRTRRLPHDIKLKPPLDKGEVGTAWN